MAATNNKSRVRMNLSVRGMDQLWLPAFSRKIFRLKAEATVFS
jgi:hypothetical protein